MQLDSRDWMAYIDSEVGAACEAKGWRHQVRRKWAVREKPVARSDVEDYEWKLIPVSDLNQPSDSPATFQGEYFLLRCDRSRGVFVLQHDTSHVGAPGPHFERETYTEIRPNIGSGLMQAVRRGYRKGMKYPDAGWLRDHLLELTSQWRPNQFWMT